MPSPYIVVREDGHTDHVPPKPFVDEQEAIEYARRTAKHAPIGVRYTVKKRGAGIVAEFGRV